jgi:hypothetical protein
MFRVTALLLVAIAMQSAAIAQDAKQDTIQVRRQPSLAQVGPLPDCDQARGRNSVPWNSDMPAPATGLRITDPNKDPLTSHEYPAPSEKSYSFPWGWDQGHSWDALNAQLPVGPTSRDNSSKNITLSVTNNITVNGPDPQSDAAIVGVHPDRTSNDLSRILQCAFQRGSELLAFPLAASRPGRPSSLLNELTVPRAPFEDD